MLAAALAGFVAFLVGSGLPRLHHPVFAAHGFERASQDRFFLAVADSRGGRRRMLAATCSTGSARSRSARCG